MGASLWTGTTTERGADLTLTGVWERVTPSRTPARVLGGRGRTVMREPRSGRAALAAEARSGLQPSRRATGTKEPCTRRPGGRREDLAGHATAVSTTNRRRRWAEGKYYKGEA